MNLLLLIAQAAEPDHNDGCSFEGTPHGPDDAHSLFFHLMLWLKNNPWGYALVALVATLLAVVIIKVGPDLARAIPWPGKGKDAASTSVVLSPPSGRHSLAIGQQLGRAAAKAEITAATEKRFREWVQDRLQEIRKDHAAHETQITTLLRQNEQIRKELNKTKRYIAGSSPRRSTPPAAGRPSREERRSP